MLGGKTERQLRNKCFLVVSNSVSAIPNLPIFQFFQLKIMGLKMQPPF